MAMLLQRILFLRRVILMLSLVFCVTIAMAGCSSLITTNSTSNSAVSTTVSTPTRMSTVAATSTSAVSLTPTTVSGPVTFATGKFIDTHLADHGSGDVTISKGVDGKYGILLDHLNVSPGPQLHVYLSATANPNNTGQVVSGVDLGPLAARQGSVRMEVATDVGTHLKKYQSVVIFCKQYLVIFTVAPLQFT